jgi:hypothetical protein
MQSAAFAVITAYFPGKAVTVAFDGLIVADKEPLRRT